MALRMERHVDPSYVLDNQTKGNAKGLPNWMPKFLNGGKVPENSEQISPLLRCNENLPHKDCNKSR